MIFNSLFTQLLLAGLAIALIYVYVQPTLVDISEARDNIALYQSKQQQVDEVNQRLALLVNEVNSIPPADQRALLTYMPDKVDVASVSRDIFTMSQISNIEVSAIKYAETDVSLDDDEPKTHTFNVVAKGDYQGIKNFLGLLEQNNYPLEVYELVATAAPSNPDGQVEDSLAIELEIVTYSRI